MGMCVRASAFARANSGRLIPCWRPARSHKWKNISRGHHPRQPLKVNSSGLNAPRYACVRSLLRLANRAIDACYPEPW
eukprot:13715222-Alexandrium_andersonii.AAC.1